MDGLFPRLLARISEVPHKLSLIDDSQRNIVASRADGFHVFKVNPDYALTAYDAQRILRYLEEHPEITHIVFDADLTSEYVYDYLERKRKTTFQGQAKVSQLLGQMPVQGYSATPPPKKKYAVGSLDPATFYADTNIFMYVFKKKITSLHRYFCCEINVIFSMTTTHPSAGTVSPRNRAAPVSRSFVSSVS